MLENSWGMFNRNKQVFLNKISRKKNPICVLTYRKLMKNPLRLRKSLFVLVWFLCLWLYWSISPLNRSLWGWSFAWFHKTQDPWPLPFLKKHEQNHFKRRFYLFLNALRESSAITLKILECFWNASYSGLAIG